MFKRYDKTRRRRTLETEKARHVTVGIDQVRLVMDVAAAQEVFAKRQGLGEAVIGQAYALKSHALERLGELLRQIAKPKGGQPYRKGRRSTGSTTVLVEPTLAELGVTKKAVAVAQQLAALPAQTREASTRLRACQPRVN